MTPPISNSFPPLIFVFEKTGHGFFCNDDVFAVAEAEKPILSAYNQQSEQYRIKRLANAWESASATVSLLSDKYQSRWNGAIESLHDHKGMLRIIWRDKQSRILFEGAIVGAWQRLGEFWCSHGLAGN